MVLATFLIGKCAEKKQHQLLNCEPKTNLGVIKDCVDHGISIILLSITDGIYIYTFCVWCQAPHISWEPGLSRSCIWARSWLSFLFSGVFWNFACKKERAFVGILLSLPLHLFIASWCWWHMRPTYLIYSRYAERLWSTQNSRVCWIVIITPPRNNKTIEINLEKVISGGSGGLRLF